MCRNLLSYSRTFETTQRRNADSEMHDFHVMQSKSTSLLVTASSIVVSTISDSWRDICPHHPHFAIEEILLIYCDPEQSESG